MEELALKLAELLEISVESAVKLYPMLREQYIVYRATGIIDNLVFFALLTSIAWLLIGMVYIAEDYTFKELFEDKRLVKMLVLPFLIIAAISVINLVVQVVFATDIVMIMELL